MERVQDACKSIVLMLIPGHAEGLSIVSSRDMAHQNLFEACYSSPSHQVFSCLFGRLSLAERWV
jgi:hypothetical protein